MTTSYDIRTFHVEARILIAWDVSANPNDLIILAEDVSEDVRWYVATNRNCPVEALAKLIVDGSDLVARAARRNANARGLMDSFGAFI